MDYVSKLLTAKLVKVLLRPLEINYSVQERLPGLLSPKATKEATYLRQVS